MLTKSTKTTIDLVLPSAAAGVVAWYIFGRSKDWRFVLAGAVITWVLLYVIVSRITKTTFVNGPAPVPTGGGCDDYSPIALADAIYNDTTCYLCIRNKDIYTTLLGLADCQLRKLANYWNEKYYSETGKSLPIMIAEESSIVDSQFGLQQAAISAKFKTLNLQ